MKTNIWIWNHYATEMFKNHAGRHYWFAENLIRRGYRATVFCAATAHTSSDIVQTGGRKYKSDTVNGIPFVFVKASPYQGNGYRRISNMVSFFSNLSPVAKEYARTNGRPDIIIASSVHPLTMVAGIRAAAKFGIPCICEVRDLWPESLIAYGAIKRSSMLAKTLYQGEKWIYRKADSIVMTWEGGKDYISDRGWADRIDLNKIKHISNGIVIADFDRNCEENPVNDPDLDNSAYKNIVYAGSIRKVNNLGMLLDAAKIIQNRGIEDIRFLIYGSGDECGKLIKRCEDENIHIALFKGSVEKRYVPSIVRKAYINILHNSSTSLDKYGQSQNKLFEYLAAGRCIVQTYSTGYSVCERAECGVIAPVQNPEEIARAVITACSDDSACRRMGINARRAAFEFDFDRLTQKLIDVIEDA